MGGLRGQVGLGWSQIPEMKILFQSFSLQVFMIISVTTYYILTFFQFTTSHGLHHHQMEA